MKKVKYIQPKKLSEIEMQIILQNWLLEVTNLGLVSISISSHIKKFIRGLKDIPLSEELQ